jgi:hypothetical protein
VRTFLGHDDCAVDIGEHPQRRTGLDFTDAPQVAQALKGVAQDAILRARLREGAWPEHSSFTFEKFTSERIDAIERLVSARRSG